MHMFSAVTRPAVGAVVHGMPLICPDTHAKQLLVGSLLQSASCEQQFIVTQSSHVPGIKSPAQPAPPAPPPPPEVVDELFEVAVCPDVVAA
jgi:hypothetical protein